MVNRVLAQRYELLENVGNGGMAEVYRAHDRLLDRPVAVKILHPQLANDSEFIEKFHSEAKGAAKLSHANIVNIYDVGEDAGSHFIVMEYVAGNTLKDFIKQEGKLPAEQVLYVALEIAKALETAHRNNLIHCDIKPHNILIMSDGQVKVADFGIARAVSSSTMTYGGDVIGSVHYFSPEQAKGTAITPKSDIYSLGVCMYEMLAGQLPFNGETSVSIALKHLQDEPTPLRQLCPNIPAVVEAIVHKAMAKDPSARPTSTELIQDLQGALGMINYKSAGNVADDPFATQVLTRITPEMEKAHAAKAGKKSSQPKYDSGNDRDDEDIQEEQGPIFKSKKFIAGLIVILLLGFGVGAFISYGNFWSSSELDVPNVVGRQAAIAQQMLEEKNLRVTIAETYDADVPEGQVVSQYPEAGTHVKEQRTITIYISKGGEEMVMPDLKGVSRANAETKLKKMGLKVTVYEENNSAEAGTVISQDVKAGSKITKGKAVDITVSKGEKKKIIVMPDYNGMSIDSARANIEANKLVVSGVIQQSSSKPAGTVIGQSPAAGGNVEEGSAVSLVVSSSRVSDSDDKKVDKRSEDTAEAQTSDEGKKSE